MSNLPLLKLTDRTTALRRRLEELKAKKAGAVVADLARYRTDPVGYAVHVLKITPTPDQEAVARAILEPPYRVLVKSGHNIGKTFLAAWLVNWWYDTRDPSATITTAPTKRDVEDLLWTEVRLQRQRAGLPDHFIGPSAPDMRTHPEHYAKGYTASTGESFQGRHRPLMFFVFDEAEGVEATYWRTANTMFQADGTNAFLAILNPTTTTSQSYQEERAVSLDGSRKWRVFTVSSLNHPNIHAQLRGDSPPIPTAVTLSQVNDWLAEWFEPVAADDRNEETDVEFPPGSGRWYRPGPEGESRVLGRRPSAGTYGVWSEKLWAMACRVNPAAAARFASGHRPELGCDVARYGDDLTEIHARCGPVSLSHEGRSGWDTVRVADRLMCLADELAAWSNAQRPPQAEPVTGKEIAIKVDDTGVGGGVTDVLASHGYNVVPVNAGNTAADEDRYPLVRDELWFALRDRARRGELDLSRLPAKVLARLEVQAMAPTWKPTADRRRKVEPKEETKKRLGRSPDGMDAANLSYYEPGGGGVAEVAGGEVKPRNWRDRHGEPRR